MNKIAIYGGLGNQMFQYCLHLYFRKHNIPSDLSLSGFLHLKHHNGFDLPLAFQVSLSTRSKITSTALRYSEPLYRNKVAQAIIRRTVPRFEDQKNSVFEKKEFHFLPDVLDHRDNYFVGTWQAMEYLNKNRELILEEFRFREPADMQNQGMAAQIKNQNAVSIHIRRGDYQKQEWIGTHAVIKDLGYYKKAIEFIETRIESPHFFIFSDDMEWVRENLKLQRCTYVDYNRGKSSYADMYLMSLCRHNIIANSTFSWWAAWLNQNPDKIVIMPEKWLLNTEAPGIFPDNWIKLPV